MPLQNYDQMKIIFDKTRVPKNPIGFETLHLALSHLVENEAEGICYLAMTPDLKKQWFSSFLHKH